MAKEPWEMTQAEFLTRGFPVSERPISFHEWAKGKGFKEGQDYPGDSQETQYIGQSVFPQLRTRAEKGKQVGIAKLYERGVALRKQYEAEVPQVTVYYQPNEVRARVLVKRHEAIVSQAVAAGRPVRPEVLKDYVRVQTPRLTR